MRGRRSSGCTSGTPISHIGNGVKIAAVAVARELVGFSWAVMQDVAVVEPVEHPAAAAA